MSTELYLSFLCASLLFGLMPGPSVCFTIAHAMRHGSSRTAPTILGQAVANAVQLLVVASGLSSILERSAVFCTGFKLAGAAYLIYLGARTFLAAEPQPGDRHPSGPAALFRTPPSPPARLAALPAAMSWSRSFGGGFVVCGTNPKALLYYAAFLPQFMSTDSDATCQLIILGTASLFVAILVLAAYTLLAGQARHWLVERGLWRAQARASGALIVAAGATLALADTR